MLKQAASKYYPFRLLIGCVTSASIWKSSSSEQTTESHPHIENLKQFGKLQWKRSSLTNNLCLMFHPTNRQPGKVCRHTRVMVRLKLETVDGRFRTVRNENVQRLLWPDSAGLSINSLRQLQNPSPIWHASEKSAAVWTIFPWSTLSEDDHNLTEESVH